MRGDEISLILILFGGHVRADKSTAWKSAAPMTHSNVGSAGVPMEGLSRSGSPPARPVPRKEEKNHQFSCYRSVLNSKIRISAL